MEWLFFDCFNTLLDDFDPAGDESGLCSLPDLAVELRICASRKEFVAAWRSEDGPPDPEHRERSFDARLSRVVAALGVPVEVSAAAVEQLKARWSAEFPGTLRLTPGVREMLEHWHGQRRMGVVSNFFVAGLPEQFLIKFGLSHYFDFVLDSSSFGYRKPGRRIFEAALARASVTPDQVTFIGDRLDLDILPAHALGMRVLHIDRSATRPGPVPRDGRFPSILHYDQFRARPP